MIYRKGDNILISGGERELAKQLGTYADAITVFSFVQSVTFSFAIADGKDFTKNVLRAEPVVFVLLVLAYVLYGLLVYRCHQGEDELLEHIRSSPVIHTWTQKIRCWRIAVIILALCISLVAMGLTACAKKPTCSRTCLHPYATR